MKTLSSGMKSQKGQQESELAASSNSLRMDSGRWFAQSSWSALLPRIQKASS